MLGVAFLPWIQRLANRSHGLCRNNIHNSIIYIYIYIYIYNQQTHHHQLRIPSRKPFRTDYAVSQFRFFSFIQWPGIILVGNVWGYGQNNTEKIDLKAISQQITITATTQPNKGNYYLIYVKCCKAPLNKKKNKKACVLLGWLRGSINMQFNFLFY